MREESLFEAVLGSHGRSEQQFEGWEAVYGPVGPDGYPVAVWDKLSGVINHYAADYMRDHGYDLREYTQRNWSTAGTRIIRKLHFFCGEMDEYYLNLGVYRFQVFLNSTANPHWEGKFTYGRPLKGHSWHSQTWAQMVREIGKHIQKNAPPGEDTSA